jgi:FKBP12-rapamycin complex-associated protein
VENFVGVTTQLFCRFDIKDVKVLEVLVKLLIKLFINYPQLLIFPLIIIKNSKRRKDKSIANLILQKSFKINEELKKLVIEYEEFVNELNKCSVLFHEEWLETIENSAKSLVNKDYIGMINQLIKMHNKMNKQMVNLYEINFYQRYGTELKEAEKYINKLIKEQNLNYLNEAWEIYHSIYKRIGENYSKFQSISLQYISTKLYNFQDSNIIMPGSFHSYYYNL